MKATRTVPSGHDSDNPDPINPDPINPDPFEVRLERWAELRILDGGDYEFPVVLQFDRPSGGPSMFEIRLSIDEALELARRLVAFTDEVRQQQGLLNFPVLLAAYRQAHDAFDEADQASVERYHEAVRVVRDARPGDPRGLSALLRWIVAEQEDLFQDPLGEILEHIADQLEALAGRA